MSALRISLSLGICTAAVAGLTWAMAAGNVENYPATLRYTINLPGQTISSVRVSAEAEVGGAPSLTVNGPLTGPVDLLVNGGDPTSAHPIFRYRPLVFAYLDNPSSAQTYFRVLRWNYLTVDNTATNPHAIVPVSIAYTLRKVNVSVNVIGAATIASYSFSAGGSPNPVDENYFAETTGTTNLQKSVSTWVPMKAMRDVGVGGTIYLRNPDGSTSQRYVTTVLRDLSSNDASVSWTIDLTNTGHVEGDIAVLALPAGASPTSYVVRYFGVGGATAGIQGTINVATTSPRYAVDLTPGDYDFSLTTSFSSPSTTSDSARSRISVPAGGNLNKNFYESFGRVRLDFNLSGFYKLSDFTYAQAGLQLVPGPGLATNSTTVGNGVEQIAAFGAWQLRNTYLVLHSNVESIPLANQVYRYHPKDTDTPVTQINSPGFTSIGFEAPTLVRANLYLDVVESSGPELEIREALITTSKNELNLDGSVRRQSAIYAFGPATPRAVSGFGAVGEPGTYSFNATALVNGQRTNFGNGSISFGAPVATPVTTPPAPSPALTLADRTSADRLKVAVTFSGVTRAGLTTLTEHPLGPAPLAGERVLCREGDGTGAQCARIYYDVHTTAQASGSAKLCIRRTTTLPNYVADPSEGALLLRRYNSTTWQWEAMAAPSDGTPARFDCSADLAVCGCVSEASCGIDSERGVMAYQLCGEAPSLPLFAAVTLDEARAQAYVRDSKRLPRSNQAAR